MKSSDGRPRAVGHRCLSAPSALIAGVLFAATALTACSDGGAPGSTLTGSGQAQGSGGQTQGGGGYAQGGGGQTQGGGMGGEGGTSGCAVGHADCNGDSTDGCEVTLDSDGNHCGACGHTCGGGACDTGACQPILLATGVIPDGLAVDDAYVYWVGDAPMVQDSVFRADKVVGGVPEVLSTATWNASHLALRGDYVYWINRDEIDEIRRVAKTGGPSEVLVTSQENFNLRFVVDDTHLLWYDQSTSQLRRKPLAGGPEELIPSPNFLCSLASGASYWYEGPCSGEATVKRVSKIDTSIAEPVSLSVLRASTLIEDGDYVWWSHIGTYDAGGPGCYTKEDGGILRAPSAGGAPQEVVSGFEELDNLVVDSDFLYWSACVPASPSQNRLWRAPKVGDGRPEVIPQAGDYVNYVASDGQFIYYNESLKIYRLAK